MPKSQVSQSNVPSKVQQQSASAGLEQDEVELTDVKTEKFMPKRFHFSSTPVVKDDTHQTCFPKYLKDMNIESTVQNIKTKGRPLVIMTDDIEMDKGGFPQHNVKFHGPSNNSNKRANFDIPRNKSSEHLFTFIEAVDKLLNDEVNKKENKNGLLSWQDKSKKDCPIEKPSYINTIQTTKPPKKKLGEEASEKKEFVPWQKINVKLNKQYVKGKDSSEGGLSTLIYYGENEEPEETPNITDVEKHFGYGCTAKFIISFTRVHIDKNENTARFSLKCLQINVTKKPNFKKATSIQLNRNMFSKKKPVVEVEVNQDDKDEEEDEGEDEGEDNQDEGEGEEDEGEEDNQDKDKKETQKEETQEEEDEEEEEETQEEVVVVVPPKKTPVKNVPKKEVQKKTVVKKT